MDQWMEGYASQVEYTAGYYRDLNPISLNMSAVLNKIEPIAIEEGFNYCELGCGQGLTSIILAANYPQGNFYAIDYSPSHIARAKKIAKQAKLTNITFLEKSFQELIEEPNLLPNMDFMVFHGIYTWVNDTNRANLVELCKRHLNVAGIVYNSYNAKPGWDTGETIQKLMFELSHEQKGSNLEQVEGVLKVLEDAVTTQQGYFSNPSIKKKLDEIKKDNKSYVIHEYLHEGWKAFYFPEVSKEMGKAKLEYLTQASPSTLYAENVLLNNVQDKLNTLSDSNNKELLKDMFLNTQFRKDLYTKGISKRLSSLEQYQWFSEKKWVLLTHKEIQDYEFKLSIGTIRGNKQVYDLIINALKKEILTTAKLQAITSLPHETLIETLVLLYVTGHISPYHKNSKKVKAINQIFTESIFEVMKFQYVVVPNIKDAKKLNSTDMAFLNGVYRGIKNRKELIEYVYQRFTAHNLMLVHNNQQITGEALKDRIATLEDTWRKHTLPFWEKLGIV